MAVEARRKRASWGQRLAFLVCLLFAIVGAVPVAFGALVRTEFVQSWAAKKTSALLREQLKVDATYAVQVKPWPLSLALSDLEVKATDGPEPFATVERVTVRPGLFALLGGRVDVGDIEVTGAHVRAVVRDGELANLAFQAPEKKKDSESSEQSELPLRSVSITDADIDLDLDGKHLALREVDVDLANTEGGLELSLRTGIGEFVEKRAFPGRPAEDAVDEDTLCHLEARARVEPHAIVVRRLSLQASLDFDPDAGTRPGCDLDPDDWRRLDVQVAGTRVSLDDGGGVRDVDGRVHVLAPIPIVHRFLDIGKASGSVRLDAHVAYARGDSLPRVHGSLSAERPGIDGKVFSKHFEGNVDIGSDTVVVSSAIAEWANGRFTIPAVTIWPLADGAPLEARDIVGLDVDMPGLLRDLGAHPQAYVGWTIDRADVARFGGTLSPLKLEGGIVAKTHEFGVYDRPASRPDRQRMISVSEANVNGTLAIDEHEVLLRDMHAVTPRSDLTATVKLGFDDEFGLEVAQGSRVDLGEVSPLVSVPIGGVTTITAHGSGTFSKPRIDGTIAVKGFSLGGFDAGDITQAKVVFSPLALDFSGLELRRNGSVVTSSNARVDFLAGADVLVDADVDTNTHEGLAIQDFFEVFKLKDDPRFQGFGGIVRGTARVHYAIGGAEDKCGGGLLAVRLKANAEQPHAFGESYDSGSLDVNFRWDDRAASGEGMNIDIYAASLRDGTGSIMAQGDVRHGVVRGNFVASGYPLARLEALGSVGKLVDGEASAIGTLGGTLARLSAKLDVTLTPLRIGPETLPGSHFSVAMEPDPIPPVRIGTTRCQNPIGEPFNLAEYGKDIPDGRYRVSGELFDGQLRLSDVTMTRQKSAVVAGDVFLSNLDLGKLGNLLPKAMLSNEPIEGRLSAKISIDHLQSSALAATKAKIELYDFHASRGSRSVELEDATAPIVIDDDTVTAPSLEIALKESRGLSVAATASATVAGVFTDPNVDASVTIAPFDLSKLKGDLDSVDRIAGTLSGGITIKGPLRSPRVTGDVKLRDGALAITGVPMSLDDVLVDLSIGGGELRIVRASASVGAGTIDVTGRVPIVGLGFGTGNANITARNIKVPIEDGFDVTVGGDLVATYKPDPQGGRSLPDVQGTVSIASFDYTRPIALNLNLTELSKNIKRTEVQAYDPSQDLLTFDVNVVSPKPLRVENDLVDMKLEIDDRGIEFSGTDQRYGARGSLRILPESKVRLRNHEFDVREGVVRFEDPTKVRADVDVRAVTEFKRNAASGSDSAATADASGSTTSGQWDIAIRAHGQTDDLKLDLSSDPPLDQEDIVLLLTIGMTRAEIDRGLASSLGETVGLEALSALTGADKAVQSIVPIIDYFSFGSSYSSHTGRTEPNVTVGKRLTDDISASVTTSLTQREVGATLEWRLKKGVSIETSYDNTSDVNSTIGNLGADLRWHLEFE